MPSPTRRLSSCKIQIPGDVQNFRLSLRSGYDTCIKSIVNSIKWLNGTIYYLLYSLSVQYITNSNGSPASISRPAASNVNLFVKRAAFLTIPVVIARSRLKPRVTLFLAAGLSKALFLIVYTSSV